MAQKNLERRAPGAHAAAAPRRGVLASFTLRTLAKNRARTVVTIIGIALATGLLAAVFTSITSLAAALRGQVSAERGVWQIEYPSLTDEQLGTIEGGLDGHLDRLATARDLGACALSEENADVLGIALNVQTMPAENTSAGAHAKGDGQYVVKKAPELESGRAPSAPGEIVLPSFYQGETLTEGDSRYAGVASGAVSDGPVELGSTVRLCLGRRRAQASEGAVALTGLNALQFEYSGADRIPLETFEDVSAPREFTVVGFAESSSYYGYATAYVSDAEPEADGVPAVACAWASTTGVGNKNDLEDLAISVVGLTRKNTSAAYPSFNSALLNLEGIIDDRTIWTTVIGFISILSGVIIVAAVSLISNAFAISISERTRQFGLLSSLGASKRQLRRTVFIEAGILGLIGIPLGVLIGLAGTYAAFAATGDGWAVLVGSKTAVPVSVDARALAVVVALSVVTLLISAWAPAKRAGSVSAVDAIRQTGDVKPSRRLLREFGRRSEPMDDFTADGKMPRGIAARVAGIPGFLARRTRVASGGKARVAVASLAISVVLLVTAGILGTYLNQATSHLDYSASTDYMMYVFKDKKGFEGDNTGVLGLAQKAAEKLKGVEGVDSAAVLSQNTTLVKLADGVMNPDCADEVDEQTQPDSKGRSQAPVDVVDDATWAALCEHVGLTGADAAPGAATCIAINRFDISGGAKYVTLRPLVEAASGTDAELILPVATDDSEWIDVYDVDDEYKPVYGVYYTDAEGNVQTKPLGDDSTRTERLRIAALTEDVGDDFPLSLKQLAANCPTLIVSASTAEAAGIMNAHSMTSLCVGTGGKNVDEDKLIEAVGSAGLDASYIVSIGEQLRNNNAVAYTAQVFLYCFTVICALIAVANVFNTISSGLALRTREFAVLRSVGLGQSGFRRMIALECADHAVRGLAYGLALALLVDYGLYRMMSLSFEGFGVALPWGHIALSVALVVAVLAASTVYALRKSHAMNLVDSLRAD